MRILFSDDVMPYGKYEGKKIIDVIKTDPDYFKKVRTQGHDQNNTCFADEVIHKANNMGKTHRETLEPNV